MSQGSVYFYKDFVFHDGDVGDKLFVMLNTPDPKKQDDYLVCLTTSQMKARRQKIKGCGLNQKPPTPSFFYDVKDDSFKVDTWIVFDRLYQVTFTGLMQHTINKKVDFLFKLKPDNFRALLNCMLKSQDISFDHFEIVKAVQKAEQEAFKAAQSSKSKK